jgi:16S rRNA (guanine527-N7)-methyltransferase
VLPEAGARPPEFFANELRDQAPPLRLALDAEVVGRLAAYLAELDVWRRRTNLTGPFDSRQLAAHALESVLGSQLISHGIRVIDIGSGAGFPGLPLAIARPDIRVTLLEPRKKRAAFLRHVLQTLPVRNAEVLEKHTRALGDAGFDLATVRAVGDLGSTLGDAGFLKPRGQLVAWTTDPQGLSGELEPAFSLQFMVPVPGADRRVLALLRKW